MITAVHRFIFCRAWYFSIADIIMHETLYSGNSVTGIGIYAFSGCTNLTDIYVQGHSSRPTGWDNFWNGSSAAVHWNQ